MKPPFPTVDDVSEVGDLRRRVAQLEQEKSELAQRFADAMKTRDRMLEEFSQQRHRAETATRAKARFLANVSHEIRTPMNGVMGMLELLQGTKLVDEQMELAHTAFSSAAHLLALIDDLLNFSKIEAGRLDLERQAFEIRACLDASIDVVRLKAERKGLRLYLSFGPRVFMRCGVMRPGCVRSF